MQGRLILKPLQAKLERDTEMFGKMDNYAVFSFGEQTFKTKPANEMGQHPKWNEVFEFQITGGDQVLVSIYDDDVGSGDDFVCDGIVKLDNVFKLGITNQWCPLDYKGKNVGQIEVSLQFIPNGMNAPLKK